MFNAHSLRNKFSDLEALATPEKFHIIGVSESWINTENKAFLEDYNLPNYSISSCKLQNKQRRRHFDLRESQYEVDSLANLKYIYSRCDTFTTNITILLAIENYTIK